MGKFDLHIHTRRLSDDAELGPVEALRRLEALGYQGMALTEHNAVWRNDEIRALSRMTSLLIIPGVELEVDGIGHVLVWGWDEEPLWRYHRWERLGPRIAEKGLVASVAHPFRTWFPRWAGGREVAVSAERAQALEERWRDVGALEVLNGRLGPEANRRARVNADREGWRQTAGSDAHRVSELGTAAVELPDSIRSVGRRFMRLPPAGTKSGHRVWAARDEERRRPWRIAGWRAWRARWPS